VALGNTTVSNETATGFSFQGLVAITDTQTGTVISVTATTPGTVGTVSITPDGEGISIK
jgi:hypothetical protein